MGPNAFWEAMQNGGVAQPAPVTPTPQAARKIAKQNSSRNRRLLAESAKVESAARKVQLVGQTSLNKAIGRSEYARAVAHPPIVDPQRAAAYSAYAKYLDQLKVKDQYNNFVKDHRLPLPSAHSTPYGTEWDQIKNVPNQPERALEVFDDNEQLRDRQKWTDPGQPWITSRYQSSPSDPYWNYIGAPSPFHPSEKLNGNPSEFLHRAKDTARQGLSQFGQAMQRRFR